MYVQAKFLYFVNQSLESEYRQRILDRQDCISKLEKGKKKLIDALKGRYPAPTKEVWLMKPSTAFISVSTESWFRHHFQSLISRMSRIASCMFKVITSLFLFCLNSIGLMKWEVRHFYHQLKHQPQQDVFRRDKGTLGT